MARIPDRKAVRTLTPSLTRLPGAIRRKVKKLGRGRAFSAFAGRKKRKSA